MAKTKKIKLATVLKLKEFVEKEISNIYYSIRSYNNSGIKLEPLFEQVEYYENELIKLKELIRDANSNKHNDGYSNDYYIYKLSNINNRLYQFKKMKTSNDSTISTEDLDKRIRGLIKEADSIKQKLTSFNEKSKVAVDVSDERIAKLL